ELGGESVPRWFNEGLAVVMEGSVPTVSAMPGLDLKQLSAGFENLNLDLNSPQANHVYAVAGAFVLRLSQRHGMKLIREYLERIAHENEPERSFERVFGIPQKAAEAEWMSG